MNIQLKNYRSDSRSSSSSLAASNVLHADKCIDQSNTLSSSVSSTVSYSAKSRNKKVRFADETAVEAKTTTKPTIYFDKNNNYRYATTNDEDEKRNNEKMEKHSRQIAKEDINKDCEREKKTHDQEKAHLKEENISLSEKASLDNDDIFIDKKQEKINREWPNGRNYSHEIQLVIDDCKGRIKKRDEYINKLELRENENKIELQASKEKLKYDY